MTCDDWWEDKKKKRKGRGIWGWQPWWDSNYGSVPTENLYYTCWKYLTKLTDCSFSLVALSLKTERNSLDSMSSSLLHETARRFLSRWYIFNHKRNKKKICYRTTWFVNAFTCGCSWSGHTWLMTLPGSATDLSKCHPRLLHTAQSKSHKLDSIQLLDFDQLRNSLANSVDVGWGTRGLNQWSC